MILILTKYFSWSAGAFDTTYVLTLTPNGDQDQPLWIAASMYLISISHLV